MGWTDWVTGKAELNKVQDFTNKGINAGEGLFNKITGRPSADDVRNQQAAINAQIQAYKDQTALSQQQIASAQAAQDVVKRQIQEKQIRSLRNNFRPAGGFLNPQPLSDSGTLSSSPTGLPNKLGV